MSTIAELEEELANLRRDLTEVRGIVEQAWVRAAIRRVERELEHARMHRDLAGTNALGIANNH
jgi:hypothetical protein